MTSFFIPDIPIYVCSDGFEGYLLYIKNSDKKEFIYLNKETNEKETSQEATEGISSPNSSTEK